MNLMINLILITILIKVLINQSNHKVNFFKKKYFSMTYLAMMRVLKIFSITLNTSNKQMMSLNKKMDSLFK
jgi:hypothetical protein